MRAWDRGPAGLLGPEEGSSYWQPRPTNGWVTLKFVPRTFAHDAAACGVQVIPSGGRIPLQAHPAAEKLWYVLAGRATATVDGREHRLVPGTTVAMCRKVPHELVNDGDGDLSLFFWVTPPGYEELLAMIGCPRLPGTAAPAPFDPPGDWRRRMLPPQLLTDAEAAATAQAADKGQAVVVAPEAGASLWQAPPAGGYIQYKVDPRHFASNRFFAGIQVLPPGGMIPPHAHTRNEEILLIAASRGQVLLDGEWRDVDTGSIAFVSRWVTHSIRNTGDCDMTVFAVFTPPGLEQSLPLLSVVREPGKPAPDPQSFTLPPNAAELLDGSVLCLPEQAAAHNRQAATPPVV